MPVEVPSAGRVAIGRGRDCELALFTDNASRRHAEVYAEGEGFLVRDLGSTNGTLVNGERIEAPRALRPGDRIGIGSCVITFCLVEGSLEGFLSNPSGHATVAFTKSVAREAFRGDLAEIPIFVVLQMLEMGHKTGMLEVEADSAQVRIWLGNGQPLHAATEKTEGWDAAVALVGASSGRFRFDADAQLPPRTIDVSMTELLLEASRQLDERGR
jgi:pSer/pThr/pTyr-binding forkhead associated (FHA) protein